MAQGVDDLAWFCGGASSIPGLMHWVKDPVLALELEGMQRQGRSSQETIGQPGGRVLVPPQPLKGYTEQYLWAFIWGAELKLPTSGRCLCDEAVFIPEESQGWEPWEPQKLIGWPPEARLKEGRPDTHPDPCRQCRPWTTAIKLLTKSSPVGTLIFLGTSQLLSPFV